MSDFALARAAARAEIRSGLLGDPPSISPKFFYDRVGSDLFDRITRTPEYYLAAPLRMKAFVDLNFSPGIRLPCPGRSHQ